MRSCTSRTARRTGPRTPKGRRTWRGPRPTPEPARAPVDRRRLRDRGTPWVEDETPSHARLRTVEGRRGGSGVGGQPCARTSLLYGDDDLARIQHDVADASVAGRRCDSSPTNCGARSMRLTSRRCSCSSSAICDVTGPLHVAGPEVLSRAELATCFARHLGLDERAVPLASATEPVSRCPVRCGCCSTPPSRPASASSPAARSPTAWGSSAERQA